MAQMMKALKADVGNLRGQRWQNVELKIGIKIQDFTLRAVQFRLQALSRVEGAIEARPDIEVTSWVSSA
ncbi:MAG: hypothetical protein EOO81_13255, partial [Oxalobacteraceae bacterium]